MNTRWRRAVSTGLCTCLALTSLAGCSKKESFDAAAAAITVNDTAISAGLVKFATHYMQSQYETMYANFGYTGIINEDLYGSGSTLGDTIKESITEELTQLVLAEQHMDEYGVSLSDEQKAAASEAAAAFIEANDAETLELISADQETVTRYLELLAIQSVMEEAMSADVDTEVSDEEAAQRKVQYTLFTIAAETEAETEEDTEDETELAAEDGTEEDAAADTEETPDETAVQAETESEASETAELTENDTTKTQAAAETESEVSEAADTEAESIEASEDESAEAASEDETAEYVEEETETESETEDEATREARAKAKAKAEEMIAKIQAGEDFETASAEVDADAYCGTTTFDAEDTYRQVLIDATEGLPDGTLVETPVEASSGYYVVYLETQIDRDATDAEKENIVSERKSDRVSELYEEWEEDGEVTTDSDVLESIVFEFSLTIEYATEAEEDTDAEEVSEAASDEETEEVSEAETDAETEAVSEAETDAQTENVSETETE
jgi:hypothetical protein